MELCMLELMQCECLCYFVEFPMIFERDSIVGSINLYFCGSLYIHLFGFRHVFWTRDSGHS